MAILGSRVFRVNLVSSQQVCNPSPQPPFIELSCMQDVLLTGLEFRPFLLPQIRSIYSNASQVQYEIQGNIALLSTGIEIKGSRVQIRLISDTLKAAKRVKNGIVIGEDGSVWTQDGYNHDYIVALQYLAV